MAIIYSYPTIKEISASDLLLISDSDKNNTTKSTSVSQLASYINLGSSQNELATIKLTQTQLLSFNGGETIELIAAPGANKVISIISIVGFLDFNSTVYNFNEGLTIAIGSNTQSMLFTTKLNASADEYFYTFSYGSSFPILVTLTPNVSLDLKSSASATVTTGDSTLTLNILYRIVDFS